MKIYEKINEKNKKERRILGYCFSRSISSDDINEKISWFGLFKKKKSDFSKEFFLLNIRIYNEYDFMGWLNYRYERLESNIASILIKSMSSVFHNRFFKVFKNKNSGKKVVLFGAGPTVNYFNPIKNAVYVGCNRAFLYDKVKFDYLFAIDKAGLKTNSGDYTQDFFNYPCLKFIGDNNLSENWQIPESSYENLSDVRFFKTWSKSFFYKEIDMIPLVYKGSVMFSAIQFCLYTHPRKIYLVGADCTQSKKEYFYGENSSIVDDRGSDLSKIEDTTKLLWQKIKIFIDANYPETEVISVNPVGLKGLFHDVYTENYLASHSEIDKNSVEVLKG